MSGGISDVKLGVFVLAALAILVVGSLWIAGSSVLDPDRLDYVVVMPDSAGLQKGDRVRYAGVSVGRIHSVVLRPADEWPVTMEISVRSDIPVRIDSRAAIGSEGFFGEVFLDILPGSDGAPRLEPGGRIEGRSGTGVDNALAQLDGLSTQADALLRSTTELVDQLSAQIGPVLTNLERLTAEENAASVDAILADLRQLTAATGPRLDALIAHLEETTAGVPELRDSLARVLAGVESALGPDGARLAAVLDSAEREIGSAGEALSIVTDNRAELEAALRDLRDTLANLEALSNELRQRPSSLVRSRPRPDRRPGESQEEPRR
jgi:phospholipid/cholesterol/gamma-HCH transport system substrate-binding protein